MFSRISILCLALLGSGTSFACSCARQEQALAQMEAKGFVGRGDVFHGRVSRWLSPKEVDVQVIEAFSGRPGPRRLVGVAGSSDMCGGKFSPREEFIYLPIRGNFIHLCSKLRATPEALARLRAIAQRPVR